MLSAVIFILTPLAVSLIGGELHPLPLEHWLISAKKWIATP